MPSARLSPSTGERLRQIDPDLARIMDAWPALPESVRASIVMLIKAAVK
jgi:hypothetical protein